MDITPDQVAYVLTIIGGYAVFGDRLVNLAKAWKEARARPNNIASDYFRALGDALKNVHAELKAKRVPHIDGNQLNTLLQSFEAKTAKVRGEKISPALRASLTAAAEGAKILDGWALNQLELEETHRVQLLANIGRAAGKCVALSTLLKR
jgi:hypothetical protein